MNNSFKNLLKNKNVVIVGSAAYMKDRGYGHKIDAHDLVVRLNRGCELSKRNTKDLGSRTDILYSCLIEQPENAGNIDIDTYYSEYKIKYLCTPPKSDIKGISLKNSIHDSADSKKYADMSKLFPCRIIDCNFFTNLSLEVNCRPTTGYIAIYDLLVNQPASLTIYGFDFFYTNWFPEYKKGSTKTQQVLHKNTLNSKRHKHKNMWLHAKKNLLNNEKVVIDDHLRKVLNTDNWWG